MFGPSMLVAPVMEAGSSSREVFLPDSERWYNSHTGAEVSHSTGWLSSGNKTTHKVSRYTGHRWCQGPLTWNQSSTAINLTIAMYKSTPQVTLICYCSLKEKQPLGLERASA